MTERREWVTSIDELVKSFRDAICALIPVAERVHMSWREPAAYDDWDRICEAIYRSIVIDSIVHARGIGGFAPISAYDCRISCYNANSFIGNSNSSGQAAFVCFQTKLLPFDRSLFALLDNDLAVVDYCSVSTEDVKFILRSQDMTTGSLNTHYAINVLL